MIGAERTGVSWFDQLAPSRFPHAKEVGEGSYKRELRSVKVVTYYKIVKLSVDRFDGHNQINQIYLPVW